MLSNAIKFCFSALLLLMVGVQLGEVRAEGTYQMDATAPQHLETDTLLFIHVDSASKYIRVHLCREYYQSGPVYADIYSTSLINGKYVKNTKLADLSSTQGNISCSDDMTSALPATPASGEAMQYQVSSAGVYAVDFTDISDNFERWDVSVVANAGDSVDPTASDGNLFSYLWRFDTPWYTEPYASDTKLYVLTPGGYSNTNYVWAVDLQGFAGDIYKFQASDIGLNWPDSGRSASLYTATISEKYPTYLSYPTGASPSSSPSTAPALTGAASFTDSAGNDNEFTPNGDTVEDTGTFSFTPNATGTYAISVAAFGGSYEQVMVGSMTENVQVNAVWDGKDRDGNAMIPAKYDVKVTLKLGEMHFVVKDVETSGGGSNDGLTLLQATNSSTLVGTQVYWDDTGIGGSGNLPNGVLSSTATTGTHRHTWGDFTSTSYADLKYVDTYTWGQTSDFSTELIYVNPAAPTITSNGGGQEASIEVNEGTTLVTNVVATGGSGSYTYSIFGDDAALFSISASGQLTFNSAPDYGSPADADTDNFYHLYVRVDGGGTLEYIHQELSIEVNNLPVADAQSVSVTEDVARAITLTSSDSDGDTLTYSIVSSPADGALSGTLPNITYTPDADFNGADSFTFKVNDGFTDSNTATVSLTVAAVNDLPTANAQSVTVTEDIAKAITLSGADVDGDSLTYSLVSSPSNGVLTGTIPNLSYTPNADYNGADSFTFKVNDGTGDSGTATVSITVNAVNDAPVADAQSVAVTEDISKSITLTGSDTEGSSLGYFISPPSNGALNGGARVSGGRFYTSTGAITYTPDANFNGIDSFTFVVNDGTEDSAVATVTLTIAAVNDLPTANAQSVTVTEDIAKAITLSGADVDGDSLTYSLVSSPSNGVLTGTIPNLSYTSNADYNGADSFTFKVNDGTGDSGTATVSITVNAVNDAPVADAQSVAVTEDISKGITLTGSDIEGSSLTYSIVSSPSNGSVSGTPPNISYSPNANFNGSDSFTFKVNDGGLDSNTAVVTLVVLGDLDGDGIPDEQDADDDGDGIDDLTEGTGDSDGDGIPDYRDTDSDNDGIPDGEEGIADTDGDGTPDYLDSSVDEDHDGIPDILEGADDPDGDGLPSYLDNDDDNDGLLDSYEAGLTGNDSDGDGIDDLFDIDVTKGVDNNADGIDDAAELRDSDADGIPDYLDVDSDNDLIPDNIEATLVRIDTDSDGIGDPYDVDFTLGQDSDGDGIDDRFDIDLTGYLDADQDGICDTQMLEKDTDLDGVADFLDQDVDNDGVIDTAEVLIPGGAGGSLVGWAQVGQLTDEIQLLDQDGDGVPDLKDLDSDNDGIMDVVEAGGLDINEDGLADAGNELILIPADTDADGIPDIADLDSDNDGVADIRETPAYLLDLNDDGRIDFSADLDADGIDDAWDNAPGQFGSAVSVDPDGDGVPIGLDKDNDNDGLSDLQEGMGDWDQDNVADYLDRDSDNDGLSDSYENQRPAATGLDIDMDGIDDAWDVEITGGVDSNGDGIADQFTLMDMDNDGSPNHLDTDSDSDDIPDTVEQLTTELSGIDLNLNGIDDSVDVLITQGVDNDLDGVDDSAIFSGIIDEDNVPNFIDLDSDGDAISDLDEGVEDTDGDSIPNFLDIDSDDDGIPDGEEGTVDTDNDGMPDYLDRDSDNDGIEDQNENQDANKDGINDRLQGDRYPPHILRVDSGSVHWYWLFGLLFLMACRRVYLLSGDSADRG